MEDLPEDKQVVDLLNKLKDTNGSYPSEMLAARRQAYQKQMANIGLGIGIGAGVKHVAKGGGNGSGVAATVTSKVLESVLIAAITLEAGTATYLYRNKIADAVKSYLSKPAIQSVASANDTAAPADTEASPTTPMATATAEPSATPSGSPSPMYAGPTAGNNKNGSSNMNANATPNANGNNGNQYGLTPKPVRTKDTGSSGNTDGGGSNNGGNNNNGGSNKKP